MVVVVVVVDEVVVVVVVVDEVGVVVVVVDEVVVCVVVVESVVSVFVVVRAVSDDVTVDSAETVEPVSGADSVLVSEVTVPVASVVSDVAAGSVSVSNCSGISPSDSNVYWYFAAYSSAVEPV